MAPSKRSPGNQDLRWWRVRISAKPIGLLQSTLTMQLARVSFYPSTRTPPGVFGFPVSELLSRLVQSSHPGFDASSGRYGRWPVQEYGDYPSIFEEMDLSYLLFYRYLISRIEISNFGRWSDQIIAVFDEGTLDPLVSFTLITKKRFLTPQNSSSPVTHCPWQVLELARRQSDAVRSVVKGKCRAAYGRRQP